MKRSVCALACLVLSGCASIAPPYRVNDSVALTAPTPGCESVDYLSLLENERTQHPDEVRTGKWRDDLACRMVEPCAGKVLEVLRTSDAEHPLVRLELPDQPPLWFYTGDFD